MYLYFRFASIATGAHDQLLLAMHLGIGRVSKQVRGPCLTYSGGECSVAQLRFCKKVNLLTLRAAGALTIQFRKAQSWVCPIYQRLGHLYLSAVRPRVCIELRFWVATAP
jgi:hypothetical protein